jgi:hypothetical protein
VNKSAPTQPITALALLLDATLQHAEAVPRVAQVRGYPPYHLTGL